MKGHKIKMFKFPNSILKYGQATELLKPYNINTFHEAVLWVWKLPYGRTAEPSNYLLVPIEKKGACSSKHAFLAEIATEQAVALQLYIGIFMMDRKNTPGIGSILEDHHLDSIPEAHCYLLFQNERYDFTSYDISSSPHPQLDFLHEELIQPNQIGNYKNKLHRQWIEQWAKKTNQSLTLDELWVIREKCIKALS